MGTSVWTHHTAATCFAASSSIPDSFATVFCKPSAPLTSSDVDASEDGAQSLATPTRSASSKTFVRLISWKWIAAGGFAADAEASSPGPVAAASSPSSPGAVSFFSAIAAAAAALSPAASAADFAWRDEEGLLEHQEERDLWAGGRTADEQIADKDEQGSGQQGLASKRAPAVGALEAPGL